MKLFFKSFLLILFLYFFSNSNIFSKELSGEYKIEISSINIGKAVWKIGINNNKYKISVDLQDRGVFSGLYDFEGNYVSKGYIKNNNIQPETYNYSWSTRQKERRGRVLFNKGELTELVLIPKETELPRIDYMGLKNHFDPLSSFLGILLGEKTINTIDARRVYSMNARDLSDNNGAVSKIIEINDYVNIWTDHKKRDLEYIVIEQNERVDTLSMPLSIKIKFKKLVFNLSKL